MRSCLGLGQVSLDLGLDALSLGLGSVSLDYITGQDTEAQS